MSEGRDPLVCCPFNSAHIFVRSHLQKHIIKCSKNYPNHFVCPYNALHRFLTKEKYTKHILACPDVSFLASWEHPKPARHGDLRETPYHDENTRAFNLEEEDWCAEYN